MWLGEFAQGKKQLATILEYRVYYLLDRPGDESSPKTVANLPVNGRQSTQHIRTALDYKFAE